MKHPVFFDSWAWIAVIDRKDPYHKEAKSFYEEYIRSSEIPVTSDYILDEVFTVLRRRLTYETVIRFGEGIFNAIKTKQLRLESVDADRRERTWDLLKKYHDKPDISFTDFTSFVIMSECGIKEVFTGDEHFEKVNMGFRTVP